MKNRKSLLKYILASAVTVSSLGLFNIAAANDISNQTLTNGVYSNITQTPFLVKPNTFAQALHKTIVLKNKKAVLTGAAATVTDADITSTITTRREYTSGYPGISNTKFGVENQNGNGGAIYSAVNISITSSIFDKNSTNTNSSNKYYGGALYLKQPSSNNLIVAIDNVIFSDNTSKRGGAIFLEPENATNFTNLSIENATFSGNTAVESNAGHGGAIYATRGNLQINNTDFIGNTSSANGGAIHSQKETSVNITDSVFADNTANLSSGYGGAVHLYSNSTNSINAQNQDVIFRNNNARYGGAISQDNANSILNLNTVSGKKIVFYASEDASVNNDIYNKGTINVNGDVDVETSINGAYRKQGTLVLNSGTLYVKDLKTSNLNLRGGTLSFQESEDSSPHYTRSEVDQINGHGNLLIDIDMSDGNSDRLDFLTSSNYPNINLSGINVREDYAGTQTVLENYIQYITQNGGNVSTTANLAYSINGSADGELVTQSSSGASYTFTLGNRGYLTVRDIRLNSGGLKEFIRGTLPTNTDNFSFTDNLQLEYGEPVGTTNNSTYTTLNMNFNGYNLTGESLDGITVADGYTLNLLGDTNTPSTISNFVTTFVNEGTLNVENIIFDGNTKAISNSGELSIGNSEFNNHTSTGFGGAIDVTTGGTVSSISNSTFENNSVLLNGSNANGGALSVQSDGVTKALTSVANTNFISNSAERYGGAVYLSKVPGTTEFKDALFQENTINTTTTASSGLGGGAVYINAAETTGTNPTDSVYSFDNVTFDSNGITSGNSTGRGGAIYVYELTKDKNNVVEIKNSSFSDNYVDIRGNNNRASGGAIYNNGKISEIKETTFDGNSVSSYNNSSYGGAVCNNKDAIITSIEDVVFTGNNAGGQEGRGGAVQNSGNLTFNGTNTFTGNTTTARVSSYGGAVHNDKTLNFNGNTTFTDNSVTGRNAYGGAIYNDSANNATINFNGIATFSENKASGNLNDIYNKGTINFGTGSTTTLNGGVNGSQGKMNIASGAVINLGGVVSDNTIRMSGGTINLSTYTPTGAEDTNYGNLNLVGLTTVTGTNTINAINNSIQNINLGNATLTNALNANLDITATEIDHFTVANSSTGTINVTVSDVNAPVLNQIYQVVYGDNNVGITLASTVADKTSSWVDAGADALQNVHNWSDKLGEYNQEITDTYHFEVIDNKSLGYVLDEAARQVGEKVYTGEHDILVMLNQSSAATREFNAESATETYTIKNVDSVTGETITGLGATGAGYFTINGVKDGDNYSTINANGKTMFDISRYGSTVEINNTKIINAKNIAYVSGTGRSLIINNAIIDSVNTGTANPAIVNKGTMTLEDVIFSNNSAGSSYGKVIQNSGGTITKITGQFLNNRKGSGTIANLNSGAVINYIEADFIGNNDGMHGGAILNDKGARIEKITNSNFISNSVSKTGGGIRNLDGTNYLNIENSLFQSNNAVEGGAISNGRDSSNNKSTSIISGTTFDKNYTKLASGTGANQRYKYSGGGAIYNIGIIDITDSEFTENATESFGGAIYFNNYSGDATASGLTVDGNYSAMSGGGIYGGNYTLADSTIINNATLGKGGGIGDTGRSVEYDDNNTAGQNLIRQINIYAKDSDVLFSNNRANVTLDSGSVSTERSYSGGEYNDVYSIGQVYLGAKSGKNITFNGSVILEDINTAEASAQYPNSGTLYINADNTDNIKGGTYQFNNTVDVDNLNIYNGAVLKFGEYTQADNTTSHGTLSLDNFTNDSNGGLIDTANDYIDNHNLGQVTLESALNANLDITSTEIDHFTVADGSTGTINVTVSNVNAPVLNQIYRVIYGDNNSMGLTLASSVPDVIQEWTDTQIDEIQNVYNWSDLRGRYTEGVTDTYRFQVIEEKSLGYALDNSQRHDREYLGYYDLLRELNQKTAAEREFNATSADETYTIKDVDGVTGETITGLGTTGRGKLTVNGVANGDTRSTINANGKTMFELTLAPENDVNTIVEVNDTKITNAASIANVGTGNELILNNTEINGTTSRAITNNGTMTIDGSEFTNNTYAANGIVYGAAFYNNTGTITKISDTLFEGNSVESVASQAAGGAICNNASAIIDKIDNVTFRNNHTYSKSAEANSGAINNIGTINEIKADFTDNYVISDNGRAVGGVMVNNGTIGTFEGNFSGNYAKTTSSVEQANSGAVQNTSRGTITKLNGNFTNNHAESLSTLANGGAMTNLGTIGDIEGSYTENYVKSTSGSAQAGALFNQGAIGDITAAFTGNYAESTSGAARGGAIYQLGTAAKMATINSINADFVENHAQSGGTKQVLGGAIVNSTYTKISEGITGDFIRNYAKTTNENDVALGGAIMNSGEITGGINGDFTDNYAEGGANARGGAIYNTYGSSKQGTIDQISGTYSGNYAKATGTNGIARGGAIYNSSNAVITSINNSTFTGNYAKTTGTNGIARGGAIWNSSNTVITSINNSTFTGNYVEGADDTTAGGAIYNAGTIGLDGTSTFSQNNAPKGGAIYNAGILTATGTSLFTNNGSEGSEGSAIFNVGNASFINALFSGNKGNSYIYNNADGTLSLIAEQISSTAVNNHSIENGNDAVIKNNGLLNLTARTGSTLTVGDEITSTADNIKGTINSNGTVAINDNIINQVLNVVTGQLTVGEANSAVADALQNVDLTVHPNTRAIINNKNIVGGTIVDKGILDIVNNSDITITAQMSDSGIINKSGTGKVSVTGERNNSGFNGTINITDGTVSFDTTGANFVSKDAEINVKNGSTLEYLAKDSSYTFGNNTFANVNFDGSDNTVVISGLGKGNSNYTLNSDWLTSNENSNNITFKNSDYVLNSTFDKTSGQPDNITFDTTNITLGSGITSTQSQTHSGAKNYDMGSNNFNVKNSYLDLSNRTAGDNYDFNSLNFSDNSTFSMDVNLVLDAASQVVPYGDTITSNSGSGIVTLTKLFITDDNGIFTPDNDKGIIQVFKGNNNLQVATEDNMTILSWATNLYQYGVTSAETDHTADSIKITGQGISSTDTLRDLNRYLLDDNGGNRGFSFIAKDGKQIHNRYNIYRDLDTTSAQNFVVIGTISTDENKKSVLDGTLQPLEILQSESARLIHNDDGTWTYDGVTIPADYVEEITITTLDGTPEPGYRINVRAFTLEGQTQGSMFELVNATNFEMTNVSVENAKRYNSDVIKDGSVIYANNADANVNLTNVDLKNNSVDAGNGGAIANVLSQSFSLENSEISGNTASGNGGAIYNTSAGEVTLRNITADNNRAVNGLGGAIYTSTDMTISDSDFGKNALNNDKNGQNDIYIAGTNTTLTFNTSEDNTSSINSGLAGDGNFLKTGKGTLDLSGKNSGHTGSFAIADGIVNYTADDSNDTFVSGNVQVGGNSSLVMNISDAAGIQPQNLNNVDGYTSNGTKTSGDIIKTGAGTLNLGGDNSGFNGNTFIRNGSILYNADEDTDRYLGGTTVIGDAQYPEQVANLTFNVADGVKNQVLTNVQSALQQANTTETITKTGAGDLVLTGDNSAFMGQTSIDEGHLIYRPEAASDRYFGGNTVINQNGTLETQIANATNEAVSLSAQTIGNISGNGNFVVNNEYVNRDTQGRVQLVGSNNFTGNTDIKSGILAYVNDNGDFVSGDIQIEENGTLEYTTNANGSISNVITGNGTFNKEGSSTLNITGDESGFVGTTNINEGTLSYDDANGGKFVGGDVNITGTLDYTSSNSNQELSNNLSGDGIFNKYGTKTVTISGDNSNFVGTTNISEGTLAYNNTNGSFVAGDVIVSGILDYTTGVNTSDNLNNKITGSGTVNKNGAGELIINETVSDNDRFTGTMNVNSGTLTINAAQQATEGQFDYNAVVNGGSTLNYNSNGNDLYDINSNAKFGFGTGTGSEINFKNGTYNLGGDLDNAAGNTTSFKSAEVNALDSTTFNGSYSLDNSRLNTQNDTLNNLTFAKLDAVNSSELKIDFSFGDNAADTITSNTDGGSLVLDNINVFNTTDNGNNTDRHVRVLNGLTFSNTDYADTLTSDLYKYTTTIEDANTLHLVASDYATEDTLYILNHLKDNTRTFRLVKDEPYYSNKDLEETLAGELNIIGRSADRADTIIAKTSSTDDTRHSMFNIVNGDTTLNIKDFTIQDAQSDGNGAVINATNTSNTAVNIENTTIKNSNSTGNGGAIYSAVDLTINNSDFENNTAGGKGNDIYLAGGADVEFTTGTNGNSIADGIASETNASTFVKKGSGDLTFSGKNEDFSGTVDVREGKLNYTANSENDSFFGAKEVKLANNTELNIDDNNKTDLSAGNISGNGTLNKNGEKTLNLTGDNSDFNGQTNINSGKLAFDNSDGDKFVSGDVKIDSTLEYTAGSNATLLNKLTGNGTFDKQGAGILTIAGDESEFNGKVDINNGTVAYNTNNGKLFGANSAYEISDGAKLNITTNSDSDVVTVQNISSEGSNNTAEINKDGNGTLNLNGDNSNYKGNLNINDGKAAYENKTGNSYIDGNTVIADGAALDYTATNAGELKNVSGAGTLNKDGAANLTFNETDNLFNGIANVDEGKLVVQGQDNATNFAFSTNITGGTFDYTAGAGSDLTIGGTNSKVNFAENSSGSADFTGQGAENTTFTLDSISNLNNSNNININNATVKLAQDNYSTGKYTVKDAVIDLINQSEDTKSFNNLTISGSSKIRIDVDLTPLSGTPASDVLNINSGGGTLSIALDDINVYNELNNDDDGEHYTYEFDVITGNNNIVLSEETVTKWATDVYEYDVTVKENKKGIKMSANKASDEHSLKAMNDYEGNRGFRFTDEDNDPYVIGEDLGETQAGTFNVVGTGSTVISGKNDNEEAEKSFFEVVNDTDLSIRDLTITKASGDEGAAVVADNENATVSLNNVNITDSTSTGDGGAISNKDSESMTVSGGTFSGNSADGNGGVLSNTSDGTTELSNITAYNNTSDGLGGAIYTNKDMKITDSAFGVDENGASSINTDSNGQNDIYIDDNATVTIESNNSDSTINSGVAGSGNIDKVGAKDLNLSGENADFTGVLDVQNGDVNYSQNSEDDTYISGKTNISGGSSVNLNVDKGDNTVGEFSGNGTLNKDGSKDIILSGDNSGFTGNVNINDGSVIFNPDDNTTYFGGKTNIGEDGELKVQTDNGTELSKIGGNGTLTKTGDGDLTLSGDNSGFKGNLDMQGGALNVEAGTKIGKINNGTFADGTSINLQNTEVVQAEDGTYTTNPNPASIETLSFNNLILNGKVDLKVDVDLKKEKADKISANNVDAVNGGYLSIGRGSLNVVTDALRKSTVVEIASGALAEGDYIQLEPGAQTVMGPIQEYKVAYGGGNLTFSAKGGVNPDIDAVNPAVMASSVATQIGGFLTQSQTLQDGFFHMNRYMKYARADRMAAENINKYAIESGEMPLQKAQLPEVSQGMWVKPYAAFEKIDLKNGYNVENFAYGTLYGGDNDLTDLRNGWKGILSAFVGYNGNHMNYNNISMDMQGGTAGATGTLYKGNFFTGITMSTGASVGEAYTKYGTDNFSMLTAGIANKTGYNWEINGGKLIVQPALYTGYTFVNTFDYTNAAGVRIDSDPLHAIQIIPGLKVIGNLENGWQPYAGVDMVWNIMDKNKAMADDVKLPQMSVKPYVQYGVGVQKSWGERFTAFFQTMLRNGGRTGVAFTAGFRWVFGKDKSNENNVVPVKKVIKKIK